MEAIYLRAISLLLVLLTFKYIPSHLTASDFYRDYLRCELHIEKYSCVFAIMLNYRSDSVSSSFGISSTLKWEFSSLQTLKTI